MIGSAEEFVHLRSSEVPAEYLRAANDGANPAVWEDVIARFPEYKQWVAHNKQIPFAILEILASDADPVVRCSVAMKNSAPEALLKSLASDPDMSVRDRVVHNKNASVAILEQLASDPCDLVADAAIAELHRRRALR